MPLRLHVSKRRYLCAAAAGAMVTGLALAPPAGNAAPAQASAAHVVVQRAGGLTAAGGDASDHTPTSLPNPAGPVRTAATGASTSAATAPLAAGAATADTSWDDLFQDYGDDTGPWTGGDGAQSLLLPDGKTMWFFGDTYLGKTNPDNTRPPLNTGLGHNSAVLQSGSTLGPTFAAPAGSGGYNFLGDYSWVAPPAGYSASRYEVLNGDQVFDNGVVYKFMQLADRDLHPDNFAYQLVGTVLQTFTYDSSNGDLTPGSSSVVSVDDAAGADPVIWGAALMISGGYVYIYGVQPYNKASLYLARAPVGELANGAEWSYWDAGSPSCSPNSESWTSDALSATSLMPGVSEGFSVTDVNGTFVLLSNDNDSATTNNAVVHYATCPSGFSTSSPAYTIYQPDVPYGYLTYEYRIVPQFSSGSNVLVSYSTDSLRVDDSCLFENYYNATIYRPKFLDVRLPGIGGPAGPITGVTAKPPRAATTPPVPPSQEAFHPTSPSDTWAATNCQAHSAPQSNPALTFTSNVNSKMSFTWTMAPTAMWLYTITWCNITVMGANNCADNSPVVETCSGQNVDCGNVLVWGSRAITLLYLIGGDQYQFTVETAKAVENGLTAYSNIVKQNWPGPTGCVPSRASNYNGNTYYFAGAVKYPSTTVGGVSATIENYSPWVAPNNSADATSEWVMLVDSTDGNDETYAQIGWWESPYFAGRWTFTQWSINGQFQTELFPPYPVNSDITYTMLYAPGTNPSIDNIKFEADGAEYQTIPDVFTPRGAQVLSELHDQASQEPGDPTNLDRVTGIRIYLPAGSGSWQNFDGTATTATMINGNATAGQPWQVLAPANGTTGTSSFTVRDGACVTMTGAGAQVGATGGLAALGTPGGSAAATAAPIPPASRAGVQSNPVSAAMLAALDRASQNKVTPVTGNAANITVSSAAAQPAALQQAAPGSRVLGVGLASVVIPYDGSAPQLVWLVSVDPAGGLHSTEPPEQTANFDVAMVSATTGKWLMTSAGLAPGLSALPEIPPAAVQGAVNR
jgi:hypothetical protein